VFENRALRRAKAPSFASVRLAKDGRSFLHGGQGRDRSASANDCGSSYKRPPIELGWSAPPVPSLCYLLRCMSLLLALLRHADGIRGCLLSGAKPTSLLSILASQFDPNQSRTSLPTTGRLRGPLLPDCFIQRAHQPPMPASDLECAETTRKRSQRRGRARRDHKVHPRSCQSGLSSCRHTRARRNRQDCQAS
jgi:hypothetical protein